MNTKKTIQTGRPATDCYESPAVALMEIKTEGVLCVSGENDDVYQEEVFPWN